MTGPDHFEIERLLRWGGFGPFRRTTGRLSVADIFAADARTGIYVLAFNDGSYYVGKASDVTGRYRDHHDATEPIEAIAFRAGPQRLLDAHEQDTIAALELIGVTLKNFSVTLTGAPQLLEQAGVVKALREVAMHLMHRETPYQEKSLFPTRRCDSRSGISHGTVESEKVTRLACGFARTPSVARATFALGDFGIYSPLAS